MAECDDFDLDRTTGLAWSRFRAHLGDHISAMGDDDVLVVDAECSLGEEATGAAPYVQFLAWGDDHVRAEVSGNQYLDPEVALDGDAEAALLDLGWDAPTHAAGEEPRGGSANFYLDAPRREADRLAVMAVGALREVFGVPHPAFLSWPDPEHDGEDVDDDADHEDDEDDADDDERPDEPLAVLPESAEHLRELVDAALTPPDGPAIEYDEDGDIPVPTGSAVLYVRVHDRAPVVELFAVVARDVRDTRRAAFEVGVLNRDNRLIKFVLLGDSVIATVHLPAVPFAPRQLRTLVPIIASAIDEIDDDLVARVGGRRACDAEPEHDTEHDPGSEEKGPPERDGMHPALLTLLHLDPHGEGVDAELAASVCEFDRALVLRFLTEASEQEIAWRRSGDAALDTDAEEAEACYQEGRGWQATLETLREALRVIVERDRVESERARRGSPGRRARPGGSRRSARARGGRQQSLIDDATFRRDTTGEDTLFEGGPDA